LHKAIGWQHNEKVDHCRRNQEDEDRIEDVAPQQGACPNLREIWHTPGQGNQRCDKVLYDGVDDGSKGCPNHNSYGQINHIPTKHKVSKSL
jgi:hypothetical protein